MNFRYNFNFNLLVYYVIITSSSHIYKQEVRFLVPNFKLLYTSVNTAIITVLDITISAGLRLCRTESSVFLEALHILKIKETIAKVLISNSKA